MAWLQAPNQFTQFILWPVKYCAEHNDVLSPSHFGKYSQFHPQSPESWIVQTRPSTDLVALLKWHEMSCLRLHEKKLQDYRVVACSLQMEKSTVGHFSAHCKRTTAPWCAQTHTWSGQLTRASKNKTRVSSGHHGIGKKENVVRWQMITFRSAHREALPLTMRDEEQIPI